MVQVSHYLMKYFCEIDFTENFVKNDFYKKFCEIIIMIVGKFRMIFDEKINYYDFIFSDPL